jgi:predicted phosphodiesterase
MRVAVISDLHANLPAVEAVAKDISAHRVHETWCLGDVVGYGGNPRETLEWVERHAAVRLQGNHDYAVATGNATSFNPVAHEAALAQRAQLAPDELERLAAWKPETTRVANGQDVLLVHGSPDDPLWEYVTVGAAPQGLLRWSGQARVILLGHTHQPFVAQTPHDAWSTKNFLQALVSGGADRQPLLIVNPGSVGQPRDGDPRASYAILDFAARTVELHRVAYDVDAAADAIQFAGLPRVLGARLHRGM